MLHPRLEVLDALSVAPVLEGVDSLRGRPTVRLRSPRQLRSETISSSGSRYGADPGQARLLDWDAALDLVSGEASMPAHGPGTCMTKAASDRSHGETSTAKTRRPSGNGAAEARPAAKATGQRRPWFNPSYIAPCPRRCSGSSVSLTAGTAPGAHSTASASSDNSSRRPVRHA